MKVAWQKMETLSILFNYKDIFAVLSENNLTEEKLLYFAKAKNSFSTSYPLARYVSDLRIDLNRIKEHLVSLSCKWGHIAVDVLQKSLEILAASDMYVKERRLFYEALIRECLVRSEETKAHAANTLANVAVSQFFRDLSRDK